MKIVINALSARMGGGQTYLINLLRYPPKADEMQVLIFAPETLKLPAVGAVERLCTRWPTENPLLRTIWEKLVLPSVLRKLGADILFCPGGVVGTRSPRGCRTVTMFRNMIPFDLAQRRKYPLGYQRVRNWILNRVMLRSMIAADLVIFISEHARRVIQKAARAPLKRAIVIPHGVSSLFSNARDEQTSRPEWLPAEYLLYVSTIDVYKAQVEVVQAYAKLKRMRHTCEKLVFVGHETPFYGRKVRQEISRLGLDKDVILVGAVPHFQMPVVYRHAKVNIFASESENCPNILLEAMAAGRPILSSSRPPMPEFGGDAVVYADPSSVEQLAGRLASLLDDETAMEKLSERAKARAMHYDWQATARRTWDALKALSAERF